MERAALLVIGHHALADDDMKLAGLLAERWEETQPGEPSLFSNLAEHGLKDSARLLLEEIG